MSFLKTITQKAQENKVTGEENDSLGGNVRESGAVDFVLSAVYLDVSEKGSHSFNVIAKDDAGTEYRETLWITNKKGEPYYEYNGEKRFLPGFNVANSIALLATGYGLEDLDEPEEKEIEVYDFDEKKMVRKTKDVLTQFNGEAITFGILKQIEDKTKLNESTGKYEPTGETRTVNVIDKVFHTETGMTVAEIRDEAETPVFKERWEKKWSGKEKNRAKGTEGTAGAPASAGSAGNGQAKPKSSLFNK